MKITREFVRGGETVKVVAERLEGHRWRVRVGDAVHEYLALPRSDGGVRIAAAAEGSSRAFVAFGTSAGKSFMVRVDGQTHTLAAPAGRGGGAGAAADGSVRAPMTGTVLDVLCKVGDRVEADQTLVVVSAMKMEHKLTAGLAGTVQSVVAVKAGTVEQGAVLVVVAAAADKEKS